MSIIRVLLIHSQFFVQNKQYITHIIVHYIDFNWILQHFLHIGVCVYEKVYLHSKPCLKSKIKGVFFVKKAMSILISGMIMASSMPLTTFAAEDQPVVISETDSALSGSYSENITWTLDEDGKLTLSGEGEMADINDNAPWFDHKLEIKTIVVDKGITKIGKNAFRELENVTSVSIPEGIKSIGDEAFKYCANLKTIKLPDSLEIIGSYAFFKCKLDSLTLPDNVTEIGEYAFSDSNLSSVIIPKGVKCISDGAFSYNGNLKEVVIPDTVSNIDGAFKYCISLKEVKIPSSVEKLRDDTFKSCNQLDILIFMNPGTIVCDENGNESETFFMTDGGFHGRIKGYKGSTAEEYAQKYHITFIALDDLETPLSGSYSENITWTLDEDGKLTLSGEGEIPDRDGITPWFGQMVNIKTIVVGEGITKIGKAVFLGLESVTSATLPEGLKSIDDGAFEECVNLKKINIPDGVESIGIEAFYKCPLESLGLPESIKTIGEKAFVCGKFRSIELPSSITRLENGAFGSCEIEDIVIPDTITYFGSAFGYCQSLKSITIPESVEKISYKAFAHCTNLETIIFENPDTIIFDEEGDVHDSFFYAWGGEDFKGVVKGYKGSTAEEYSVKYKTNFEVLISEKFGDSNGDGTVSMADAVLIMQSIANPAKYGVEGTNENHITEQGKKNADIAGENDGVTNADALAIQKKLLKLD